MVDGTGEGSVGRAAEMMSTAHTPTTVLLAPRKAWLEKRAGVCGGPVEAPIGRTPLPRDMGVDGSVGVP